MLIHVLEQTELMALAAQASLEWKAHSSLTSDEYAGSKVAIALSHKLHNRLHAGLHTHPSSKYMLKPVTR